MPSGGRAFGETELHPPGLPRFQVQLDGQGVAIYYASDARTAVEGYLCDRLRGKIRPHVEEADDGSTATLDLDGERIVAVRSDREETR